MTIVYKIANSLYLNITNRCPCDCTFCIRNNGDGVGGSDSLWLEYEPDVEEIIEEIRKYDLNEYKEIVFCGYGEPLMRLDTVIEVCRLIKSASDIIIRINTNGLGNLINKQIIAPKLKGLVDIISISLNAPDKKSYTEVTRPVYGDIAFDNMLKFAKECKNWDRNGTFRS
jgi:TatD family-associated radical SAM protein